MSGSKVSAAKEIVKVAMSKVGSRDWLKSKKKGEFPKGENKCNLFVSDVLTEAGVDPPPMVPYAGVLLRIPTAGEWANRRVPLTDWIVVLKPQPGDVAAEDFYLGPGATGHVGIVVGNSQTVSSSSYVNGIIVKNDWGFRKRGHQMMTFRRYVGWLKGSRKASDAGVPSPAGGI